MPFNNPKSARSKTPLLLLLPAVLLTACAHSSPAPSVSPVLPPPPSLSTPLPPVSYSLSVGQKLQTWQKRLMDTQMMSE